MKPLVSIVTVTYNSEKTLKDTIESVLKQSYPNIEYIIVDGLSTDSTFEIAKSFEHKFFEKNYSFKIISEKDNGIYDAMNKGIRLAEGDIIGMINSDDWYELNAIDKVVKKYNETHFDLMYADLRLIKENNEKIKKARIRNIATSRDWNHPTMFVKKDVYNRYQYKVGKLYSDFDLWLKVRNSNFKIVILNVTLANFRFGGVSNEKNIKKMFSRVKERYSFYRENGYSRLYIMECISIELAKLIIS